MSTVILALESATEACSVALWLNGAVESRYRLAPNQQTQYLLPMVAKLLAEAGISLARLDAIAFGQGPGSFTGVRIATAVAQGLALGADRPLIGLSTLLILAQGARRLHAALQVAVAIDARMQQLYWGSYRYHAGEWHHEAPEALLTPAELLALLPMHQGDWVSVGNGWHVYPTLLAGRAAEGPPSPVNIAWPTLVNSALLWPHAQDMLPLAVAAWGRGALLSAAEAQPCYLRNQVAMKRAFQPMQASYES